ncbi:hypothetical protein A6M14_03775 [Acinetobacter sp. Ac_877]|nr:hypothetical protein [Acinetobacter portensis]
MVNFEFKFKTEYFALKKYNLVDKLVIKPVIKFNTSYYSNVYVVGNFSFLNLFLIFNFFIKNIIFVTSFIFH